MARISIPTKARLPSTLRVNPSNPAVSKILSRLSRSSLISVALDWLKDERLPLSRPYVLRRADEEEEDQDDRDSGDFYPAARSVPALRELYQDLQARKGSKREVLDRITEGDWRHGLSLYQLAIADLQYLYDHPTSQKWTAYHIVPLKATTTTAPDDDDQDDAKLEIDKKSLLIPRFHPSTFLQSLQETTLPDVKAHYSFDRHPTLPILILRIFLLDSPYNTSLSLQSDSSSSFANFDVARTIYISFPDDAPHIYISKPQTLTSSSGGGPAGAGGESKSLRTLIIDGIPKALSRPPHMRYTLKSTSLVTKNLNELLKRRGAGRGNSAGGGWSIYAGEKNKESPLDIVMPMSPPLSDSDEEYEFEELPEEREQRRRGKERKRRETSPLGRRDELALKRARKVAKGRFGKSGLVGDGRGVERVDVVLEDAFPFAAPPSGEGAAAASRKRRREDEDGEEDGGATSRRSSGGKGRKSALDMALNEDDEDDQVEEEDPAKQQQKEGEREWRPNIKITFHGSHVFAGIRQLVERGVIDGERMPGWMTGEEGVTLGIVRHGRIKGHKGAGL
ncbi:centromere protein Chl4/mis15/CENP-N [Rhypophila decipiens]|uniref:Centromere protein Chl4/mis15/CENP-N n=1 Tax=Rhypophila decipiens TaxID=261697 RepID=A0AAN6XYA0_9PEZI|nr:centromere protein Chl4/mis15/CENP-N [Rhypophila decipiens]